MATMTAPPAPPPPSSGAIRQSFVVANLMPDEVLAARDARRLKQRIGVALGGLVALVLVVFGVAVIQTQHVKGQLASEQIKTASLQQKQRQFAPLVTAQTRSKAIQTRLTQLMVGDVQWKDLLASVRSQAKNGVHITSVAGAITIGAGATSTGTSTKNQAGLQVLNQTGKQGVGTLTVIGTAPDKNAVAAYIDSLADIPGLAAPFPASINTSGGRQLTFTANVILTSDILGGRFLPGASQGGK